MSAIKFKKLSALQQADVIILLRKVFRVSEKNGERPIGEYIEDWSDEKIATVMGSGVLAKSVANLRANNFAHLKRVTPAATDIDALRADVKALMDWATTNGFKRGGE